MASGLSDILALQKMMQGNSSNTASMLNQPNREETMGKNLTSAASTINPNGSFGGGLAQGFLQGAGMAQSNKGASKKERMQEYLMAREEWEKAKNAQINEQVEKLMTLKIADEKATQNGGILANALQSLELGDTQPAMSFLAANQEIATLLGDDGPGGIEISTLNMQEDENGVKAIRAVFNSPDGTTVLGRPIPLDGLLQRYAPNVYAERSQQALLARKTEADIAASEALATQRMSQQDGQKPPAGYRFTQEGNLEAIPGGPAAQKAEMLDEKQQAKVDGAIQQAERLISKVDQALSRTGGMTAGVGEALQPGWMKRMTGATDLAADLETIKANLGFAELQAMREASPTGGALGQVAVQELVALQSTIASLDQAQSPEQLKQRLNEIRTHYDNWRKVMVQARNGETQPPQGAPKLEGNQTAEQIRAAYQAGQITREQARAQLQQLGGQ